MDKKFVQDNREALEYLYDLQSSGRTNMYGATSYLQSEQGLDKATAREVLQFWMGNYEEIAKELGIEI
jgi:hypothetical protein